MLTATLIPGGYMWATGLPADKYQEWSSEKEIFVQMRNIQAPPLSELRRTDHQGQV